MPHKPTDNHSPMLFEIAWEVCNQVGGIYTVIRTKSAVMQERWGENYFFVGPYIPANASIEFESTEVPDSIRPALSQLNASGGNYLFGRWLIPGRPQVILVDYRRRQSALEKDKYFLWKDHGIPGAESDTELNDFILFGFAVAELFKELAHFAKNTPILAHFHEWLASVALPRIAHLRLPIATVFHTHATLLGRYIANDDPLFYRNLSSIEPEIAARHYNIASRHAIERAGAWSAHYFTTISEVTAREAEKFLGRKPDAILPNGLNIQRFTALHEFQNLHLKYKERIHEFVMGHFFPSYTFDLDRTIYLFTSGRYEYRNKGMDVFIEAMHRLNLRLKELPDPPTIVAFIISRTASKNINVRALQSHLMFDEIKNVCLELQTGVGQRILSATLKGKIPAYDELLPNDFQVRLKRAMHAFKSDRLPAIVTHDLFDDGNDPVLRHLRHRHLYNHPHDPVKVIFHPDFVSATSPLFGLDYDQFVRGCHVGVFPSAYEPWGYTPLECIALGLPAVTTDLSGFGTYVRRNIPDYNEHGIFVLNRTQKMPEEGIEDLTAFLYNFVKLTRRERIDVRNRAERLSENFDWSLLGSHYHAIHDQALKGLASKSNNLESTK